MELLQVPQLTARQTALKEQLTELEKLKSQTNYLRLNEDPTGYLEQSKFLERYAEQTAEFAKKADGYARLVEGWKELEAHFGSPEGLFKALCELVTAEAKISTAQYRNSELKRAKLDPEQTLMFYAKELVKDAHPAKSVRKYGQHYFDRLAENTAYAFDITTEQATAKARALISETKLAYNAKTDSFKQTISL